MARSDLVTLDEAAASFGWRGQASRSRRGMTPRARRLLRYLLNVERRSGVEVMVRLGTVGRGTRYRVNLTCLRAACPELGDQPSTEIQRRLAANLSSFQNRMRSTALEIIDEQVEPQIADLRKADLVLADAIEQLSRQIPAPRA